MFFTEDAGDTWQMFSTHRKTEWFESIFFIDSKFGWTAGGRGEILCTTDGGQNWDDISPDITHNLCDIFFLDHNNGWAVGGSLGKDIIIHTNNGGKNWDIQSVDTYSYLNSVFFIDQTTGWAAGTDGTILHTENGGENWTDQSPGIDIWLETIQFLDKNTGWAAGHGRTVEGHKSHIFHTKDGGITWVPQIINSSYICDIYFKDAQNGWAVGTDRYIHYTKDGGQTWQESQNFNEINLLSSVCFANNSTGWAGGYHGRMFKSTDAGNHWDLQFINTCTDINSLYFMDDKTGWLVTTNAILHTTTGGE